MALIHLMYFGIKKSFFLISFCLLFSSCYREFDIEPPVCNNCTKPVVLCFITPNSPIRAFATTSVSFNDYNIDSSREFKGQIFISDSLGLKIELSKSSTNPQLFSTEPDDIVIEPGKLYFLSIIDENGNISIAETRVPEKPDRFLSCDIIGFTIEEDGKLYITKLKWDKNSAWNNLLGWSDIVRAGETPSKMHVEYNFRPTQIDSRTLEYFESQYWRYSSHYTLFTINEPFARYFKNFDFFDGINVGVQTQSFVNIFNGIIPEYSNFDNSIGVFGGYLTDTISVINPYPSPYN
ncbi:MAG: DUF4249 family protein [Bacteroidales bacterium]|nr:DUF4249 family protein [Bacteroidales bacterium]